MPPSAEVLPQKNFGRIDENQGGDSLRLYTLFQEKGHPLFHEGGFTDLTSPACRADTGRMHRWFVEPIRSVNQGLLVQKSQMRISRFKIFRVILVRVVRYKANIHGFSS